MCLEINGILSPFMLVDDTVQSVQQNVRSVASSLRGLPQDFNLITMEEFERLVIDFPTTGELFDLLDRNIPQENRVFEIQGLIPPINIDNFLEAREDISREVRLFRNDAPRNLLQSVTAFAQSLARTCLLYTSPSPRDRTRSRMPSSA